MPNIIKTYLDSSLRSVYNLWMTLNRSSDSVVSCFYFHLPYRVKGQRFALEPSTDRKNAAQNIATWMNTNVRSFVYQVLTIENYAPEWTSVPDLECIKKASEGSYDSIYLPHTIDDEDTNNIQLRAAAASVRIHYASGGTVTYPLRNTNLGCVDAVMNLPADVLAMVDDPFITARKTMLAAGSTRDEIIALETQFRKGEGDYAAIEDNGEWFIDSHPQFGSYISSAPFLVSHPYYKYLIV